MAAMHHHPLTLTPLHHNPYTEKSALSPPLPLSSSKAAHSTVTCAYQAHIAGSWRDVTVLWCKNLMNHSLTLTISSIHNIESEFSCKIDLKPWHFWCKKGLKSFEIDNLLLLDVYWDLRSAKFSGSPEPCGDFYVAVVYMEEVVLLLGDYKKKAYRKTRSRPALVEASLFYKKENVFAKKCFSTRARFDEHNKDHDIVVESSTVGPRDPEMWISIDGIVVVHVMNLQWKFRGNETVVVNKQAVHILWNVHDWLFNSPGVGHGHGLFIFKPCLSESTSESDRESSCNGAAVVGDGESDYFSTKSSCDTMEFCLLLYAWKVD